MDREGFVGFDVETLPPLFPEDAPPTIDYSLVDS